MGAHVYAHVYTHVYTLISTHVYTHVSTHVSTPVSAHVRAHVCGLVYAAGMFFHEARDLLYILCGTSTNGDHYLYAYTTDGAQRCAITIPSAAGTLLIALCIWPIY